MPPSSLSFQITELWHIWPISVGIGLSVIPQEGSSDLQQDPLPSLLQGGRDVPLLLPSFTQQSEQAWEKQPAWNHIASIDLITPLLCGNLATAFCFQARSWGDKSCYYLTHLPHATWPILLCLHPLLQPFWCFCCYWGILGKLPSRNPHSAAQKHCSQSDVLHLSLLQLSAMCPHLNALKAFCKQIRPPSMSLPSLWIS